MVILLVAAKAKKQPKSPSLGNLVKQLTHNACGSDKEGGGGIVFKIKLFLKNQGAQ